MHWAEESSEIRLLLKHLRVRLERDGVRDAVEEHHKKGTSSAGTRREEIFNKEFLCPEIAEYFLRIRGGTLALSEDAIRSGLGAEGSGGMPDHGFTPKLDRDYFFTKSHVLQTQPPDGWMNPEKLTSYRSYADFGVRQPLPVSLVGELKYEYKIKHRGSAVKALYEVTRQCVFYLGAFGDEYECAVGLIADATDNHIIYETFDMLPEALRARYGEHNRLHLMVVRVR